MQEGQTPTPTQQSSGLDPKLAAVLAYLFSWLGGLIIFLIEKDNKEVRFHALQSIGFAIGIFVVYVALGIVTTLLTAVFGAISDTLALLIGSLVALVYGVLGLGLFIYWIILMVKGYNLEHYKVPVVGNIVEKYI